MKTTHLLFLTHQLPFPPKSGGTVKSWNYVKFLSENYTVSVASLLKDDDKRHLVDFEKAIQLKQLVAEEVDVHRTAFNLVKSYSRSQSLSVFRNYSHSFKRKIKLLFEQVDTIVVDHYEMFQYVPYEFKGKIVMHTHNAEFMLWQRMSELMNNPVKKLILKVEALRVKKYEKKIFDHSDLIYSTPSDIDLYAKHGFSVTKHKSTFHLGNDSMLKLPNLEFSKTEKAISFIGTLSWEPNIDGICWFLDNCWNTLKQNQPDLKLYILGKDPDERILKSAKNDSQIIFTGFVKELDSVLQKTRAYIVPLRFGSGMKVKVLEGLYRGNPCVTTSVGAEGLKLTDSDNIFIADEAKKFTNDCITLLENESIWNKFRDKVRALAKAEYTWDALFEKMDKELKDL